MAVAIYDCSAKGAAPHPRHYVWGYGSVGSAFDLQSKGHEFEDRYLHHTIPSRTPKGLIGFFFGKHVLERVFFRLYGRFAKRFSANAPFYCHLLYFHSRSVGFVCMRFVASTHFALQNRCGASLCSLHAERSEATCIKPSARLTAILHI